MSEAGSEPSTDDFIRSYLEGEPQAVARVDRWILASSRSYQRRLGGHFEDVVQEIRLEVFRLLRAGKFRGESKLRTYIWRVAGHTCLDHIRKGERWRWSLLEEDAGEERPGHVLAEPERVAAPTEARQLLLQVREKVSQDCWRLWRWIHQGLTYREMSRRVGVSEGTLRVRVLRCRRRALEIRDQLLTAGGESGS